MITALAVIGLAVVVLLIVADVLLDPHRKGPR